MSENPIAVIGLDPPETETVHELVFVYPDARTSSPMGLVMQGYTPVLSDGDGVTAAPNGSYLISYVKPERTVRVQPNYLWVEERVFTREKKPLKPKAPAKA